MVDEKKNEQHYKLTGEKKSGERIREIRKQLNLRQKEFAEKLRISGPTLSEIETGKFKPGYDLLVKLAKNFNVNLYYVLFGEGDMFIDPVDSYFNRARRYAVNLGFFYSLSHTFIVYLFNHIARYSFNPFFLISPPVLSALLLAIPLGVSFFLAFRKFDLKPYKYTITPYFLIAAPVIFLQALIILVYFEKVASFY